MYYNSKDRENKRWLVFLTIDWNITAEKKLRILQIAEVIIQLSNFEREKSHSNFLQSFAFLYILFTFTQE